MDGSSIIGKVEGLERMRNETIEKQAEFYGYCNFQCPTKYIETGVFYAPHNSDIV